VAHHQEADGVHAEVAGRGDVLGGKVGFGAVGDDAQHSVARTVGGLELVDFADAGEQECGRLGVLDGGGEGFDPFEVGVGAEPVDPGGAGEPVAEERGDRLQAHASVDGLGSEGVA
jgi:hypothetical protein